ncbi:MAG: Asp23/Gls24 family envelope stress response protein [Bacilli bacterium]|nr:Asp23/Gls24 family envelope stress response protein [Bacilli bacterium]
MADYIYINSSDRGGELAISRKVFARLAEAAVGHTSLKGAAKVKQPVKVVFKKDGRVEIGIHVTIKRGAKLTDVCLELQKEIAHALEVYVEAVPFEIEVSVDEVK